ncbi:Non-histone chromosomal protein 6 [Polyrhizophydium stewartii]|uniref:Non-histone chromosomal protein 6 n=1 Tax=Polyrhizophydium stewartii TaxID=2732419 RepID=A0ABR4N3T3_9FUNG
MPPKAAGKVAKKSEGKTRKDPDAPKKPLSAFMIFSKENRPRIKEENPDASFGEIGKLLGAAWRELSEKEKQVYNDKADEDKARYDQEVASYQG